MAFAKDPGQKFDSDVHRRILGHVSLPDDKYGWSAKALFERIKADVHPTFNADNLKEVLAELEKSGHVEQVADDVWRQTKKGFEDLTAEPPVADGPRRPAEVGAATPLGEHVEEKPAEETGATNVEG